MIIPVHELPPAQMVEVLFTDFTRRADTSAFSHGLLTLIIIDMNASVLIG